MDQITESDSTSCDGDHTFKAADLQESMILDSEEDVDLVGISISPALVSGSGGSPLLSSFQSSSQAVAIALLGSKLMMIDASQFKASVLHEVHYFPILSLEEVVVDGECVGGSVAAAPRRLPH